MNSHSLNIIQQILQDDQFNEQIDEPIEMVIQLDSQRKVSLLIKEYDDPMALAQKFCYQHNIDPRIITTLAKNIRSLKSTHFNNNSSQKENTSVISHNNNNISTTMIKKQDKRNGNNLANQSMISQQNAVFDRLYQDSKAKQAILKRLEQTSVKKPRLTEETSCGNVSTIYERNVKIKQALDRKCQYLRTQKSKQQLKNYTFHPKIDPISNVIASRLRVNNYSLLDMSREKKASRIMDYLIQREQKQMKQCTFEPKTATKRKPRSQSQIKERCFLLHEDHNLRETKRNIITQKIYDDKLSFKPELNKISTLITQGKSFEERLRADNMNRQRKSKQARQRLKSQEKRHPSTGRPPKNRNKGQKNVGEYLYYKAMESTKNKKQVTIQHKVYKASQKSEKIYDHKKKMAFRYIFTLMDSDQDGYISALKINIMGLQAQLLQLLTPLLIQMEQMQAELDENQFIQALNLLFKTFTIHQKNMILNVYKQAITQQSQSPSFHPSINEKSLELTRSRDRNCSLYDAWKRNFQQKQSILQHLKALKQMEQYQQCTFQPNLFPTH